MDEKLKARVQAAIDDRLQRAKNWDLYTGDWKFWNFMKKEERDV